MPKISVIIPVYNVEPYLRRCLDSIVNQTLSDIEIICINDGSTDNSLDILKEYEAKDSRIKIINFTENCGVATARNTGIKAAIGKYIGFIDSDDYVDLDFYDKLYTRSQQTDADIIKGADLKLIYPDGKIEIYRQNSKIKKNKLNFWSQYTSAIYKSELILENKIEFPPGLIIGEDPVFATKSAILANKVDVIDDAQYYYCRREDSLYSEVWGYKKILSYVSSTETVVDFALQSELNDQDRKFLFNRLREDVCNNKNARCGFNSEYEVIFDKLIIKLRKAVKNNFPVKLLFDSSTLVSFIDVKRRSEIFWVVFNLVKQFIKDERFNVTIFLQNNWKRNVFNKFPEFKDCKFVGDFYPTPRNGNFHTVKNTNFNITDYDVYFKGDLFGNILDSTEILPHFYFLYDTILLLTNHDKNASFDFYRFYKTALTKDSYCFCDSQSCKDNFLRFFPILDENKITIAPIATANEFYSDKDENKIKKGLERAKMFNGEKTYKIISDKILEVAGV